MRLLRGTRAAVQVCVRNEGTDAVQVRIAACASDRMETRALLVGLVPVPHHSTDTPAEHMDGLGAIPGLAPDPLLPASEVTLGPQETRSFWITLYTPPTASTGPTVLRCSVELGTSQRLELARRFTIDPFVAEPLRGFPITHWFYGDAIADWYGVAPCSDAWWRYVRAYMADLVAHHNTCIYVPIFTPPTDGVKRPCQLLGVQPRGSDDYDFDWTEVERWIEAAIGFGAEFFEWTHLFTQWGASNAIRIYCSNDDPSSGLWSPETPATAPVYRRFLARFLPEFRAFLEKHGLLDKSFFHLSDEPGAHHLPNYRAAREMLRELAPWMRVMDAMSHVEFAKEGLTDIPIASIAAAREFRAAGVPAWVYFCCGPRGAYWNRLLDTPLARLRMGGRLLHALEARGFLHWGYNYWYRSQTQQLIDPFVELAGDAWPGWPYGDPFVVYPGPDGPISSVRWEIWAEAMQDLAILRQLGVAPDDPRLASIRDYDDFHPADPDGSAVLLSTLP